MYAAIFIPQLRCTGQMLVGYVTPQNTIKTLIKITTLLLVLENFPW